MSLINKNWNALIKPSKLLSDISPEKPNKGKFVIEPLERGFALTIGNALRRVLLSSLQGAAITAMKVHGLDHEFSTIEGVKEDAIDLILNLKSVIVKMHATEKKQVQLKATGPCVVTAGMISTGHDVEVLNPDAVICTLAEGASIEMQLTCEMGKGYVPAISAREHNLPIGVIPIDAVYSPIKTVSYKVENTRVGQMTDYDKLLLEITTDGSVAPDMGLAYAARILQDQLQLFISFEDEPDEVESEVEELPFNPVLLKKVDEIELSVRSQNCLKNDNIVYIGDLVIKTEAEMLRTPNFGRKSLNEIKEILSSFNLKFGMDVADWPPENVEELAKKYEDPY